MALKNFFVPVGPVTRTITRALLGKKTSSNAKKGQHFLSHMINFPASRIDSSSPGKAKRITVLKLLSFNHYRPELGKKHCFMIAQFYGAQGAS